MDLDDETGNEVEIEVKGNDEAAKGKKRRWFILGEGVTKVNGLEIKQLPQPSTEGEEEEQRIEWSFVENPSEEEV